MTGCMRQLPGGKSSPAHKKPRRDDTRRLMQPAAYLGLRVLSRFRRNSGPMVRGPRNRAPLFGPRPKLGLQRRFQRGHQRIAPQLILVARDDLAGVTVYEKRV